MLFYFVHIVDTLFLSVCSLRLILYFLYTSILTIFLQRISILIISFLFNKLVFIYFKKEIFHPNYNHKYDIIVIIIDLLIFVMINN